MKNKQFTLGAIISYFSIAFNIITGLLYTPWMIKTIGDDQYALYTLAISIVNLLLLDFGIGGSVTKFLSNFYARGEQDKANAFMGIVYKVFFIITAWIAVILTIMFFFLGSMYKTLSSEDLVVLKRLYIIVAVYSVVTFPCIPFTGTLTANERFIEVKLCELVQRIGSVILIIVFLIQGRGVYALLLVTVITNALTYLAKYIFIRRKTKTVANLKFWDRGMARELFGFSIWLTIQSIAQRFIFNIMPSIIIALAGSAEVTLFSLASTIEGYVYTFTDAINGMFMPKVARLTSSETRDRDMPILMEKVAKYHMATLGLLFIGFICVGQHFVSLWMGEGFEVLYMAILLLIFPSMISTPQQVASTSLLTMGIVKPQAIIFIVGSVINVGIAVALLPYIGVLGACISVMVAYLLRTALTNILLYKKHLPIKLSRYFFDTYARWGIVAVITVVWGVLLNYLLPIQSWSSLFIKAVGIGAVYLVLFVFIDLKKEDRNELFSKFTSIVKK